MWIGIGLWVFPTSGIKIRLKLNRVSGSRTKQCGEKGALDKWCFT